MNKKSFMLIFISLILVSFANAVVPTDTLILYNSFDSGVDLEDIGTGNHDWINGGTTSITGILGEGRDFDGGIDKLTTVFTGDFNRIKTKFTVNFWIKTTTTSREGLLFGGDNAMVQGFKSEFRTAGDSGKIQWSFRIGAVNNNFITTDLYNDGVWVMHTIVFENNQVRIYKNGTNRQNVSIDSGGLGTMTKDWLFGCLHNDASEGNCMGGFEWNGDLDELGVWNDTLTSEDISELYNGGVGLSFPFTGIINVNWLMNVTAQNNYNNSINNFDVRIFKNGSIDLTKSTTNGTVHTSLNVTNNDTFNFTFTPTNYFTKTFNLVNSTNGVYTGTNFFQSEIKFNVSEIITGTNINNYTINDSTFSVTTTNGSLMLNLLEGNQTLDFTNTIGYHNYSFEIEVIKLDNLTINLTAYNHQLTFVSHNNMTNVSIDTFTINMSDFDGLGYDESFSTTTGSITFNLSLSVNYSSLIDGSGFALVTANHTGLTGLSSTYNYSLQITNTIDIIFRDATTNNLMNGTNITAQFIGDLPVTKTTLNSTLTVNLLIPDTYTILYTAEGFEMGKYILTVIDRTYNPITLYLQNDTQSSLVLITVNDKFGNELQGVKITIQRWSNDAWITEQIIESDFQGRTEAYYVLSTTFYNHILEFEGLTRLGIINDDTNKKLIFAEDVTNGINFNIDILGGSAFTNYYNSILGVSYNLSFVNTTNSSGYFRFFWNDNNGGSRTGCLDVTFAGNGSNICHTCTDTSTGTIFCFVNQTVGLSLFVGVGSIDSVAVISLSKLFGDFSERLDWGVAGYIFGFIIVLVSFFAFLSSPTIGIMVGSLAFVALGAFGIMFSEVSMVAFIGILVVSFLVARIKSEGGVNG